MASTVIVAPARLGSTRFPEKLLHPVLGRPLIRWTAEGLQRAAGGLPVFFAVDDERLREALEGSGCGVLMTRGDHPTGTDRLAEANQTLGAEFILNIQADEPLVTAAQIKLLHDLVRSGAPMATLAAPIRRVSELDNPAVVKVVIDLRGRALYFSRLPIPYRRDTGGRITEEELGHIRVYRHLGMYGYHRDFLSKFNKLTPGTLENLERLEQLRAIEHGYPIMIGVTTEPSLGIDRPEDVPALEAWLRHGGSAPAAE
ncbi:MAG: 3-deoxy-manno-octulosonate cytidylyltransferase [Puniceicoccaceae bacterium]|nr:MAG: 3-deoxy-manno-octulosonate cytidylyltransferase [Puniceicoccaceae bacterium]